MGGGGGGAGASVRPLSCRLLVPARRLLPPDPPPPPMLGRLPPPTPCALALIGRARAEMCAAAAAICPAGERGGRCAPAARSLPPLPLCAALMGGSGRVLRPAWCALRALSLDSASQPRSPVRTAVSQPRHCAAAKLSLYAYPRKPGTCGRRRSCAASACRHTQRPGAAALLS